MDLKIDNKILKSSAVKNPATEKWSNNLSANKIMIALITTKINQKLQLLLVMLKNKYSVLQTYLIAKSQLQQ